MSFNSLLADAATCNDLDRIRKLVTAGADPAGNYRTMPILWWCSKCDSLRLMCELGADVSVAKSDGRTMLHAMALQDVELAECLINLGCPLDTTDSEGDTPLLSAVTCRLPETVKLLLKRGANINARNNDGWSPLHTAIMGGAGDVFEILLSHEPDLNITDNDGMTPLMFAVIINDVWDDDFVQRLLEVGADIQVARRSDGFQAIHLAAEKGSTKALNTLVRFGADLNTLVFDRSSEQESADDA
jgi:ankyrin repeat protein